MEEYRQFVGRVADGVWPSQTILNRSADHAAVIIENLFRKADSRVEILTSELKTDVYGLPTVIGSAVDYLRRNDDAEIRIIAESPIDRRAHPFLNAIEEAGLSERTSLKFISSAVKQNYKFNFAVADAKSFRFEESRESFEAIVGFGHDKFASRLHTIFNSIDVAASV